jgi:hypothetical protein
MDFFNKHRVNSFIESGLAETISLLGFEFKSFSFDLIILFLF